MKPFSAWRQAFPRPPGPEAFTLTEVLVALAVLSLIVVVMAQMFNMSFQAISQNTKTMYSLDASESVLQQIGLDVSRIVLRDDVDYSFAKNAAGTPGNLPGNDSFSFYARTSGLSASGFLSTGSPRPLAVVKYQVAQNAATGLLELDCGAQQIDWDNAGSNPFVFTTSTQLLTPPNTLPQVGFSTTLASEIIRMELAFVLVTDPNAHSPSQLLSVTPPSYISATNIPKPIRNIAGILVGIVVIDPQTRLILPAGVDMKIARLFPDAVANEDMLALWTPVNTSATLQAAGVPARAVSGVRIYEKYFPFPW